MIKGIKIIRHNAGNINEPDDPSYPFRLDMFFRAPEFMVIAFIGLYGGTEEICVRGKTKEALEQFVEVNEFKEHPRLIKLEITQPELKPV